MPAAAPVTSAVRPSTPGSSDRKTTGSIGTPRASLAAGAERRRSRLASRTAVDTTTLGRDLRAARRSSRRLAEFDLGTQRLPVPRLRLADGQGDRVAVMVDLERFALHELVGRLPVTDADAEPTTAVPQSEGDTRQPVGQTRSE